MILLAISDAVWLAIIGVVVMVIKEYFERERAKEQANKVAEVKTTLVQTTEAATEQAKKQDDKLNAVSEQIGIVSNEVAVVKTNTDGMATAMGIAKKAEGVQQGKNEGIAEERDRADTKAAEAAVAAAPAAPEGKKTLMGEIAKVPEKTAKLVDELDKKTPP